MADRANYEEYAAQCIRQAGESSVPEHKALLLMMAEAWIRLAEQNRESAQAGGPEQRPWLPQDALGLTNSADAAQALTIMYTNPQRRSAKLTQKLRGQAGCYLRELREKRGLSQRELAQKVGAEYYTFISQLEHGRGRIPPDRYLIWADALGVKPREFVRGLMSYYDPVTYDIIFRRKPGSRRFTTKAGTRKQRLSAD
jgi:ribosome-binding protein aMBF1 (putative translation factor)